MISLSLCEQLSVRTTHLSMDSRASEALSILGVWLRRLVAGDELEGRCVTARVVATLAASTSASVSSGIVLFPPADLAPTL